MQCLEDFILSWLLDYLNRSKCEGFVIGISGGVDSALTANLCAKTGKKVVLLNMPIRQTKDEFSRACLQIAHLEENFKNVSSIQLPLTSVFDEFNKVLPELVQQDFLALANSRSRLRMTTLYAVAQAHRCLVVGTGNKVEDFGIGFYTKYGDGGVDISPIADLTKTEVFKLAKEIGVIPQILNAKPTDGLWEDGRTDEDQIGASYPELEWAMEYTGDLTNLSERQMTVLGIYKKFNAMNQHKMQPIPVCIIPSSMKSKLK
ncbi:MAG: NAD(+) synthase [Bacteroidetes bacterium]|nr:NAD(+) synthase [Bacteroidota bacterium]